MHYVPGGLLSRGRRGPIGLHAHIPPRMLGAMAAGGEHLLGVPWENPAEQLVVKCSAVEKGVFIGVREWG